MAPWSSTKAKVQLRLSVQRLRTLQEKKEAQAKAARRDIATLLERGKVETARIKVESSISYSFSCQLLSLTVLLEVINEDIYLELLELLELYCELLIARFGLVEQNTREPDPAVSEGICSVIYAAPRTELKELHVLRDLLMHKYGREFSVAVMENRDGCVSERVMKKLTNNMPSASLVEAYLTEIAKGYGIQWNPDLKQASGDQSDEVQGLADVPPNDAGNIAIQTNSGKSTSTTGEGTPKLPDIPPTEDDDEKGGSESAAPKPLDDFAMLAKRFEALKKR